MVVEAVPPLNAIAVPATPSIVKITVPVGVVVTAELPDATVAVSVTVWFCVGNVGETPSVVVEAVKLDDPASARNNW